MDHSTINKMNSMNWPQWWKITILLNIALFNMLGNIFASGVSSMIILFVEDLHISFAQASQLSTWALLALGLSNLWARPTAAYISKRYTILFSMLLFIVCNVWGARAQSAKSLLASRIVGGLGGGVVETLGPEIISELFPEHQLARAMFVYTFSLASGAGLGPVIAGFVGTGTGTWRWFLWVIVIAGVVNFIGLVLMMPETTPLANRSQDSLNSRETVSTMEESGKGEEYGPETIEVVEKASLGDNQHLTEMSYFEVWSERSFYWRLPNASPHRNWFIMLVQPLRMLSAPAVLVTFLIYGVTIAWIIVCGITVSTVYSQPPHLWQTSSVGLLAFGPVIGPIIGGPFGGPLADWLYVRMMRRNAENPRFEIRLLPVLPSAIISPSGLILVGMSFQHNLHWIWTVLGTVLASFGISAGANPLFTYCIDAYPEFVAETATLLNVAKNCLGAGLAFVSVSWYMQDGGAKQFGTMAGVLWALYLLVIPLYFIGDRMRRWPIVFTGREH